ncbi:Prolactin-induced protein [Apodemus speciosus]|uniref:Prolactin-induced protein n=1 Tax=Apodemus speciosus TaxID=105296 RepID=A0ABQ0EUL8_APOSI
MRLTAVLGTMEKVEISPLHSEAVDFYYESGPRNYTLTLNMKLTPITNSNKKANEFLVQLTVTNNVKECMEVAITTDKNPYITYRSDQSSYDACVCTVNDFFWNIYVSASTYIRASASVLPYKNKCPEFAHLHVDPYQIYNITQNIHVTP